MSSKMMLFIILSNNTVDCEANFHVFFLFQGMAVKQDYSRQGQEKKEERKVNLLSVIKKR